MDIYKAKCIFLLQANNQASIQSINFLQFLHRTDRTHDTQARIFHFSKQIHHRNLSINQITVQNMSCRIALSCISHQKLYNSKLSLKSHDTIQNKYFIRMSYRLLLILKLFSSYKIFIMQEFSFKTKIITVCQK